MTFEYLTENIVCQAKFVAGMYFYGCVDGSAHGECMILYLWV